jgi:hypothetical protein
VSAAAVREAALTKSLREVDSSSLEAVVGAASRSDIDFSSSFGWLTLLRSEMDRADFAVSGTALVESLLVTMLIFCAMKWLR